MVRDNCQNCGIELNKFNEAENYYCVECYNLLGFGVEDVE